MIIRMTFQAFFLLMVPGIDFDSSHSVVPQASENASLGDLIFQMDADDFSEASVATPIYIQIHFDNNVFLSNTVVDLENTVLLGIKMVFTPFTSWADTINADPLSLDIVRWIEGENDIWFRVRTSSSMWINRLNMGTLYPVSSINPVTWAFGQTIAESLNFHSEAFLNGYSNLISNADGNSYPTYNPVSTKVMVSLVDSTLTAGDPVSFSIWSGSATGVESAENPQQIIKGLPLAIQFSGDFITAIVAPVAFFPMIENWPSPGGTITDLIQILSEL